MKLNNKGFAITAVLYGLLILFVMLVSSYLMILSSRKNRLDSIISDIEDSYGPKVDEGFDFIEEKSRKYTIPKNGTYLLEVWGAQGGDYATGGPGGYARGEVELKKGTILYIYIGSQGESSETEKNNLGGYNGGGVAGYYNSSYYGYGGGGATHIATSEGELKDLSADSNAILIVAGGGGGGYHYEGATTSIAGSGGGFEGGAGTTYNNNYDDNDHLPTGGGQSGGGSGYKYDGGTRLGMFGTASQSENTGYGGGGGGGYYGGGTGYGTTGAGGSGYIGDLNSGIMYCYNCTGDAEGVEKEKTISTENVSYDAIAEYAKKGNGYARITSIE